MWWDFWIQWFDGSGYEICEHIGMHKWIIMTYFRLKEYNYDFVIFLSAFLDYLVAQQVNITPIV